MVAEHSPGRSFREQPNSSIVSVVVDRTGRPWSRERITRTSEIRIAIVFSKSRAQASAAEASTDVSPRCPGHHRTGSAVPFTTTFKMNPAVPLVPTGAPFFAG